ncbi:hypothetical protein P3T73_02210 [Kiritimatiellota bacterium B12222]|nr:hypothetical protein P3T73_02210 [Kiritimatiellota bacterium B12222]
MSEQPAKIIDIGDESMLGLCEDGRKIWLEGPAIPGDEVRFELDGKFGQVLDLLKPAPDRRPALCPHFDRCPGCQLQPLPYARQLELKSQKIVQAISRVGGFDHVPFLGMQASPEEWGTRNKLDLTVQGPQLGYQTRNGLLPISGCPVGHPLLNELIPLFQTWLNNHPRNQLHRLLLRCDGERQQVHMMLRGVLGEKEEPSLLAWVNSQASISQLSIQDDWQSPWESLIGKGQLSFNLADHCHTIDYDAFFQVHDPLADHLIRDCMDWLGEGKAPLLDLFSGAGAFTFPAAQRGWQVLGLDTRPGTGPFKSADLRKGLSKKILKQPWKIVLTDPPRSGMEEKLCTQIRDHIQPQRILYTSCNPATLARDLKRLCQNNRYSLQKVKGYDLFPQTTHVETLVLLQKT